MKPRSDLTSCQFGRLTALHVSEARKYGKLCWECVCDCGAVVVVPAANLRNGNTRSCGCLKLTPGTRGNVVDMTGRTFGRWTVLGPVGADRNGSAMWTCRCACGVERLVVGTNLRNGGSRSCGCLKLDRLAAKVRHGMADTLAYKRWESIKQRCTNPKNPSYKNYGGRGITMCAEWAASFERFFADVGECPGPGLSLDRIDNDGNYEPGNVRWATNSEQMRNRRPLRRVARADYEALEAELERVRALLT